MIKNVVFDIGNVLVDFAWKDFCQRLGYSEEVFQRIVNATVKSDDWCEYDRGVITEEEIIERFVENDPGIEKELREANKDFNGLLVQFEYAKGWILDLQKKGYKVYALSNMSYKAVRECADSMNFLPMMDGYILSCDVKLIKPDPAIYHLLEDKYGLKPEETVFFDDTEPNIKTANECGWHGIRFENIRQAVAEFDEVTKKEGKPSEEETGSRYTKGQRVAALVCVGLIVLVYLAALVLSLIKAPWAHELVKIAIGCTLVLPILTWIYIWMIGKLTHKKTIADFNFFESKK